MGHATFNVGQLKAVIGDNSGDGIHRPGYNGIWDLRNKTSSRNLFVPFYAGLNHEHIFSGDAEEDRDVFFEPRTAAMTFRKIADDEAELHQPPTPTFHLESWTHFKLVEPYYIDMTYRCVAHQHVFHRDYIGLFWASYMNAPNDKSMYFLEGADDRTALWEQLCTQRHNDESTVKHRDDKTELSFDESGKQALFRNLSPKRFATPLFYGLCDNQTWIVMFDRTDGIRFAHSPSGGGVNRERKTANPAWDFQFIIPEYEISTPYSFRLRAVLRPQCTRESVLEEYRKWADAE